MTSIFTIDVERIQIQKYRLTQHPLLHGNYYLRTIDDLRLFMEHHVWCVWDFMSLLKTLQVNVAPSCNIWTPKRNIPSEAVRLINEIVLCEESDITPVENQYMSHFDLYLTAMREIGANYTHVLTFTKRLHEHLENNNFDENTWKTFHESNPDIISTIPPAALRFVTNTMKWCLVPHHAAAAFCYGRETIIPAMFQNLLRQLNIGSHKAPFFHFYLERHIQVDGEEHGNAAERLITILCGNDPHKILEAEKIALDAIETRFQLWSDVEKLLIKNIRQTVL
jgi:hypothetical protein